MQPLKLTALDPEDLEVISAHMQDAIVRVGEIAYLPKEKTLAIVASRFGWETAVAGAGGNQAFERRRSGLRIHRVLSLKCQGVRQGSPDTVLSLLAIIFHPDREPPGGTIELTFSGGSSLRAEVECIEAALNDLGPAWKTRRRPSHADVAADERGRRG